MLFPSNFYKKCAPCKKSVFSFFGQQPTAVPNFWAWDKQAFDICNSYLISIFWNSRGPLTKNSMESAEIALFCWKCSTWVYITSSYMYKIIKKVKTWHGYVKFRYSAFKKCNFRYSTTIFANSQKWLSLWLRVLLLGEKTFYFHVFICQCFCTR